jgi:hypothetical protein
MILIAIKMAISWFYFGIAVGLIAALIIMTITLITTNWSKEHE